MALQLVGLACVHSLAAGLAAASAAASLRLAVAAAALRLAIATAALSATEPAIEHIKRLRSSSQQRLPRRLLLLDLLR